MKKVRFDPGTHSVLLDIPWEKEKEFRMNPETVTALLREQVPALEFVDWRIVAIDPGSTESILPLNPQATNQHFTHQAALFLLAADYTGGTALASLLTGWPVVGVHPVTSTMSVSMWLLKGEIKYAHPSVADLRVIARIDENRHGRVRNRFAAGKPVIESIKIEFKNGNVTVAEATVTYFARQSEKLRSDGVSVEKVNSLYELKLTSSAEMIAGVRARENGRLFHDPFAAEMAGQHGLAMATRFCQRSPQLGGMIAARTWHLDAHLEHFLAGGGRDILIVGVGWDMRAFRLKLPVGTRIYELDFPTTLAERSRRLASLGISDPAGVSRIEIPIDLRTMPLADVMREHLAQNARVFLAWEGMSMYFEENEVRYILEGMSPLLTNPDSLLWCDVVDRRVVKNPEAFAESVQVFMRGMQILGEPFTFGVDAVEDFFRESGFCCHEVVTSDVCLHGNDDPVYSIYKFCVASSLSGHKMKLPATIRSVRDGGLSILPLPGTNGRHNEPQNGSGGAHRGRQPRKRPT